MLLAALIAVMVLVWAFNFIIGKVALRQLDPVTLAAFRVELAGLVMAGIYLATPRAARARVVRRDLWKFAELGFFGVVLNQMLFTVGLNFTSVSHSSLIVSLGPIFVLLIARAHGLEAITPKKLAGMGLSFVGVTILAAERGLSLRSGTLLGDLITLTASVGFAVYAVTGKRVAERYDSLTMNAYNYLTAAVVVFPLAVWRGMRLDWGAVGWAAWAGLAYMAVFASVAAYLIYYWALRYMAASRLAATSYLLPVLATLLGVLLLGDRVTGHLVGGGTLVLVGVYLTQKRPREEAARSETWISGG